MEFAGRCCAIPLAKLRANNAPSREPHGVHERVMQAAILGLHVIDRTRNLHIGIEARGHGGSTKNQEQTFNVSTFNVQR